MITGLRRLELCKTLLGISYMKPEGPPAHKQDVGRKHQFSPGSVSGQRPEAADCWDAYSMTW